MVLSDIELSGYLFHCSDSPFDLWSCRNNIGIYSIKAELHFKFGREKQLSNPLAKGGLVGPQYGNWIFFLGFPDQMSDHEQTMSCPPLPSPK